VPTRALTKEAVHCEKVMSVRCRSQQHWLVAGVEAVAK
jgi:hypothetical protein